jgi:hypothetical protein
MGFQEFLPQQYFDCMRYGMSNQFPQNQYYNFDELQRQNITGHQIRRPNESAQNNEPHINPAICDPLGQLPSISQYKYNEFIGRPENVNLGEMQNYTRQYLELPHPVTQRQEYNTKKEQDLQYWHYSGKEQLVTIPHSNPQPSSELHSIPFPPYIAPIKKHENGNKELIQKKAEDLFQVKIDHTYYAKLYAEIK